MKWSPRPFQRPAIRTPEVPSLRYPAARLPASRAARSCTSSCERLATSRAQWALVAALSARNASLPSRALRRTASRASQEASGCPVLFLDPVRPSVSSRLAERERPARPVEVSFRGDETVPEALNRVQPEVVVVRSSKLKDRPS
ncbi:unnamed protein product [Durusdinium trenchii]|uniref:Uncharacterized protein n=1 Tax=Durusdinium trenchii TaxID=1381693 RepID=A0ABP0HD10_9DINO